MRIEGYLLLSRILLCPCLVLVIAQTLPNLFLSWLSSVVEDIIRLGDVFLVSELGAVRQDGVVLGIGQKANGVVLLTKILEVLLVSLEIDRCEGGGEGEEEGERRGRLRGRYKI